MSRAQILWLHLSVAVLTISGGIFAWMKYGMTTDDPFAVVNHPWQPRTLALHVLAAPLVLFILGWTFSNHMLPKVVSRTPVRRRSGLSSLWLIVPMALSGYLLQVTSSERWHSGAAWGHWITSSLFVLGYLIHQFLRKRNGAGDGIDSRS